MSLQFTTLDDQADPTFNQLLGINNSGKIAGYFGSGDVADGHPNKGYTLTAPYGQQDYTNENFPGSVQTQVTGLNDGDDTVGFWADANGDNFGFVNDGGRFINVNDPNGVGAGPNGTTEEQLLGVNDHDVAVGFYMDANGNSHGFTYNIQDHKFQAVNVKGFDNVTATGINNEGDISGFVGIGGGNSEGFVKDGNHTILLTGPSGAVSTQALGLNDEGQVVGSFMDAQGNTHGFLYNVNSHSYTQIDDPNGNGTMTVVNGINDRGQAVGFYVDGNNNTDGMVVQVGHAQHGF